eukprot:6245512-Alexandrium_andersonii.AAC.1
MWCHTSVVGLQAGQSGAIPDGVSTTHPTPVWVLGLFDAGRWLPVWASLRALARGPEVPVP